MDELRHYFYGLLDLGVSIFILILLIFILIKLYRNDATLVIHADSDYFLLVSGCLLAAIRAKKQAVKGTPPLRISRIRKEFMRVYCLRTGNQIDEVDCDLTFTDGEEDYYFHIDLHSDVNDEITVIIPKVVITQGLTPQ